MAKSRLERRSCIRVILIAWIAVCSAATTFAGEVQSGLLGPGEAWETPWYIVDSGAPGPTVLVVGGMHGNEPAGFRATEQIRHWPVAHGKLVILPRVNRLGLAADLRWAPHHRNDRQRRDLNRNFPTLAREQPLTSLCRAVWMFIQKHDPDWVFDLHEGFDFHCNNARSVGSSVIAFPRHADFAQILKRAVNAGVQPNRQFVVLAQSGPVRGSLARACAEQLDANSFILETTFKEQPVSLRTRQHRRMVATALLRIGLIEDDCSNCLAPPTPTELVRVAIFDGPGANETKVLRVLDGRPDLFACRIGPKDIRPEILEQFDVLVFPGGSGSKQGKALGATGREHVRQYVKRGGGLLGICAGAYLCTTHYDWSLNVLNAAVFNKSVEVPGQGRKSLWYRGPATNIDVEITNAGAEILGIEGLHSIRYQNGPILSPDSHANLPAYRPLAYFRSENGIYPQQEGTMVGAPAVVTAQWGKGRVLAISPHFETTKGREAVIVRAIEYAVQSAL